MELSEGLPGMLEALGPLPALHKRRVVVCDPRAQEVEAGEPPAVHNCSELQMSLRLAWDT